MATGVSRGSWNGQLPTSIMEGKVSGRAEMQLSYPGKSSASSIRETLPAHTSELWRGASDAHAFINRLYFGDNLPLLAGLLRDRDVRGKVRLVYIDPPYATNGVFQSRCQSDAYHDLLNGVEYIEFLRQRLILLHDLLAEDGSIYVHLDQKMAFQIKVIMDEVFGAKNFRGCISRRKCNPKNYTKKTYGNVCDYILFYTKTNEYVWNRSYEEWTPERATKEYPYVDKETGRRFKKVPIHAPGVRRGKTGEPWRGKNPPPGKHWQYLPEKLDEFDARGEIYWSPNGNPRRKVFFEGSKGVPVQDLWTDLPDAHNQMVKITGYPTEKNPQLLSRLIEASSNAGDLVLDCFAGSGTTLAVASQLDRRWIGIDNSPEAVRHMLRRFASGRERMGDYVSNGDRGKKASRQERSLFSCETLTNSTTQEQSAEDRPISDFALHAVDSEAPSVKSIVDSWLRELH